MKEGDWLVCVHHFTKGKKYQPISGSPLSTLHILNDNGKRTQPTNQIK